MLSPQNCNGQEKLRSSGDDSPRVEVLKATLQQIEGQKEILEHKVAKQEQAEADVSSLRNRLENLQKTREKVAEERQRTYDSVSWDLDETLSKNKQTASMIDQLKQENHELQCCIHSKMTKELKIIDRIKKLETVKTKSTECIRDIDKQIKIELEHGKVLRQQNTDLQEAIASKTMETQNACRIMVDKEKDVQSNNKLLAELSQWKVETGRTFQELKAENQKRNEELEMFREQGPEKLAQIDRHIDMATKELEVERSIVIDWKAKREHAEIGHQRLKESNDKDAFRMRSTLKELEAKNNKLAEELTDLMDRLQTDECKYQRLIAAVQVETNRLANLMAKIDRLEQQICYNRLQQQILQTKYQIENKLLEDSIISKKYKLSFIEADVEELQKTSYSDRTHSEKLPSLIDLCSET